MCPKCQVVRRKKRVYVVCKANKRHKQRQGFHTVAASIPGPTIPISAGPAPDVTQSLLARVLMTCDTSTSATQHTLTQTLVKTAHNATRRAILPWFR
jgi:ribosomal protein L36